MKNFVISHNNDNNIQLSGKSINDDKKNSLKSSYRILNNLYDSVSKDLSQSVRDLTNCFICLSPATNPLSCPKCNNFACKACLKKYFNNSKKSCPLCKNTLSFNDWKINNIIINIEKILDKNNNKKNKAEELSKLIEQKKKEWNKQTLDINTLIEKLRTYENLLEKYKTAYKSFFISCQNVVDKVMEKYYKKLQNLKESLSSYNKYANDSIMKLDDINKNNKNNYYSNNEHIKNLINELLSMERKHFNEKNNDETEKFLQSPIKLAPILNQFNLLNYPLDVFKPNADCAYSTRPTHPKIGKYYLSYNQEPGNNNIRSILRINLPKDTNACFLITQTKTDNIQKFYPMILKSNEEGEYEYECEIPKEEFPKKKEEKKYMSIDVMKFQFEN